MTERPVIFLDGIRKQFTLPKRKDGTLLARLTGKLEHRSLCALQNISFSVKQGEVLGIVGDNAAGKSTLLRIIAGIIYPTAGTVQVDGKVTSLIAMSVALRKNLTVRDNVFLASSCFGMTRAETRDRFASIITFGGLERYVDLYPYQLSDGMNQRLAFSIAIHAEPEILLLDEVFSAGDVGFAEKASKRMEEVIRGKSTVVVVSHSMDKLKRLCDRVLWLENGCIRAIGDPDTVIDAYVDAH